MSCKFSNVEQAANLMANKEALILRRGNKTQQEIVEGLVAVNNVITKPTGSENTRYKVGHFTVSKRITDRVNKDFEKGKTKEQLEEIRVRTAHTVDIGDFFHVVAEQMGNALILPSGSRTAALAGVYKFASEIGMYGYKFSTGQLNNIQKGIQEIIDQINEHQRIINKVNNTDGKAHIMFELSLLDPERDEAGTIDVVAIYSDGTANIFDYKTTTNLSDNLDVMKLFGRKKRDGFKMQLSSYQRMLVKYYDIKAVTKARVVPVFVQLTADDKFKLTKSLKKVLIGRKQNDNLTQIPVIRESSGFQAVDELLSKLLSEQKKLQNEKRYDEAKALDDPITQLLVTKDYGSIVSFIHHQAKDILEKMKNNEKLTGENSTLIKAVLDFISEFKSDIEDALKLELISSVEKSFLTEARDLIDDIEAAYYRAQNYFVQQFATEVKEKKLGLVETQGSKALVEDRDASLSKIFEPLSQLKSSPLRWLHAVVEQQQHKTEQLVRGKAEELTLKHDALVEWLRANGKTMAQVLLNRKNGRLISELTSDFFKDRDEAITNGDYGWLTKNLQPKENYLERYNEKKARAFEQIEREAASTRDTEHRDRKIAKQKNYFESQNSLALKSDGTPAYPSAWRNMENGFLEPTEAAKIKYKSEEWAYAESHKPIIEYINTVYEINKEIRKYANIDYKTIPDNFLPWVRKDLLDKIMDGNPGITGLWKHFIEKFEINQDDQGFGAIDENGERYTEKTIPLYFTNPFRNSDGTLNVEEKSFDFTKSMILFMEAAYNYAHMKQIEGEVQTINSLLHAGKIEVTRRSPNSKIYLDEYSKKLGFSAFDSRAGLSVGTLYEAFMDKYLYGIHLRTEGKNFGKYNSTKALMTLKNWYTQTALGAGIIPGFAAFASAGMQQFIEGFKGVVYDTSQLKSAVGDFSKSPDSIYAMYHFFGVGPESISHRISVSNKDKYKSIAVGDRHYTDALRKYVSTNVAMAPFRVGDAYLEAILTRAMAKNFMVDINTGEIRQKKRREGRSDWKLIEEVFSYDSEKGISLNHMTNEEAANQLIINFRRSVRDVQYRIKGTISESDVAWFQTNIWLQLMTQFKTWVPGIVSERGASLDFNKNIDSLMYGRYRSIWDEMVRDMVVEEEDISAMAGFTKMMVTGFLPAVKEISKDFLLGTITLGRIDSLRYSVKSRYYSDETYKSRVDLWIQRFKETNPYGYEQLLEANEGNEEKLLEELLEVRERSLRSFVSEMRIIAGVLALLGVFAGGSADGDDGEKMWKQNVAFRNLYRVSNRVFTEMTFTFNPGELKQMFRSNVMPMTTLVQNFYNVGSEVFDTVLLEGLLGQKPDPRDKHTIGSRIIKIVPVGNQLSRFFEFTEIDKNSSR